MGPVARVLWLSLPELLHVGAVIGLVAVSVGIMGNTLFGFRAEAMSSLGCEPCIQVLCTANMEKRQKSFLMLVICGCSAF